MIWILIESLKKVIALHNFLHSIFSDGATTVHNQTHNTLQLNLHVNWGVYLHWYVYDNGDDDGSGYEIVDRYIAKKKKQNKIKIYFMFCSI